MVPEAKKSQDDRAFATWLGWRNPQSCWPGEASRQTYSDVAALVLFRLLRGLFSRNDLARARIVAGMVGQVFTHLLTRNADFVRIFGIVTDNALRGRLAKTKTESERRKNADAEEQPGGNAIKHVALIRTLLISGKHKYLAGASASQFSPSRPQKYSP